ncbi:MAG: bacteriohemerythrin [Rhodocyclales bacterium]|nr:bacteriohemerythrin [Rhodocyclales bacterium]
MMLLVWKDEYCTGMERIDHRHRMLVDQLNSLYARLGHDTAQERVTDLLARFCRYVDVHFATEEHLAREGGFPRRELEVHLAEHRAYRMRVEGYRVALHNGDALASVQLMAFIHYWWVTHILGANRALGHFLCHGEHV